MRPRETPPSPTNLLTNFSSLSYVDLGKNTVDLSRIVGQRNALFLPSGRSQAAGRSAPDHHPAGRRPAYSYELWYGPCCTICCPKGPWGATSETRSSAPLPTRPSASGSVDCTLYNTLPKGFRSCTLSQHHAFRVTFKGPRRGCAAGQQHPALWVSFIPQNWTRSAPCHWPLPVVSLERPAPAPCRCHGNPQQVVLRPAQ